MAQHNFQEMCKRQALPDEILHEICVEASLNDRYSAYALAFVCRKTYIWTAEARWRTIVLRTNRQLLSFWKIINSIPDDLFRRFQALYLMPEWPKTKEDHDRFDCAITDLKDACSTWFEKRKESKDLSSDLSLPHTFVRYLHIDLKPAASDHEAMEHHLEGLHYRGRAVAALNIPLRTERGAHGSTALLHDILRHWSSPDATALSLLSLGSLESTFVDWIHLEEMKIHELTIVMTSEADSGRLVYIPRSVRRIHIIGQDPDADVAGVPVPFKLLRILCRPESSHESFEDGQIHRKPQYVTHIRYDTRRFSFKPAEITARRLLPLLREITIDPHRGDQVGPSAARASIVQTFQHNGPRHAAPARGAGSFLPHEQTSRVVPVSQLIHDEREVVARYLDLNGVGHLRLLHFVWDPAPHSSEQQMKVDGMVPWYKRNGSRSIATRAQDTAEPPLPLDASKDGQLSRDEMYEQTGGWPREVRGAWTESSESGSRAAKKDPSSSFAIELRDAISSLFGWHAAGIEAAGKFSARMDREQGSGAAVHHDQGLLNHAFSPEGTGTMVDETVHSMDEGKRDLDFWQSQIKNVALRKTWHSGHPEWLRLPDDVRWLRFGIRAPRSLLHLGGQLGAFTQEERQRLFEDRSYGGQGAWP